MYRDKNKLVIEIEYKGSKYSYRIPGNSSAELVRMFTESKLKELKEKDECQQMEQKI